MIRKPMQGNRTITVQNQEQMGQFAAILSQSLHAGDFIALTGGLGTGKTTFTRLLCQALGVKQNVTSPTFTLINEYDGRLLTILHGDLYRLNEREIETSLPELEERFESPNTMVLMEWADKAPQLAYRWTWHLDFAVDPKSPETTRILTLWTNDVTRLEALPENGPLENNRSCPPC